MIDIGRVFSTSFAMLRQRFWPLVGMWAVFLAIQMAASTVLAVVMVMVGMAGVAGLGAGFDDPAAFGGLGIVMIVFMVLFYGAYIVLLLAQQAAMVTLGSPLEEPVFGTAMNRGFRSALPFFGLSVLLVLAYFALTAAVLAVMSLVSVGGGAAGGVVSGLLGLLMLPLVIWLACRLSVLVAVVAVDQVFNPVTALRRSWAVTRGKALRILLALAGFIGISLVALAVPFVLIFFAADMAESSPGAGIGLGIVGLLIFVPLFVVYTIYTATFTAALHCEVTEGGAEQLEEVFA